MTQRYKLFGWAVLASLGAASGQVSPPSPIHSKPGQESQLPAKSVAELSVLNGGLALNNASLTEVIELLASELKINYVLDPRVQGSITLNTYGETKALDARSLLEAILRINGDGMVQQGDFYRIVPLADVTHLAIPPEQIASVNNIADDDRLVLNLVFVKYLSADELLKVLNPFLGENATAFTYPPANLILILDSHRNVRRLLELISLFDDVKFERERVRIFSVKNARPSDLAKELESVVKPLFAAATFSPILLLPIDRIGAIVAVTKSPSMFPEIEKFLAMLDIPASRSEDTVVSHVYKVKFGDAKELANSIMTLYGTGGSQTGTSPIKSNVWEVPTRNGSVFGSQVTNPSSFGASSPIRAEVGPGSYVGNASSDFGQRNLPLSPSLPPGAPSTSSSVPPPLNDFTGSYMSAAVSRGQQGTMPRVVARASNFLMIQALPADYEIILNLLRELDVPPLQVLIEAKIYEVDLTYGFTSSVSAALQELAANSVHQFLGNLSGSVTNLTIGGLVGRSRELLGAVQLEETHNRAKVISAPSILATDGIAATMNVGTTVPTLSAQAVTGVQQNGSSLFANSVVNQDSGITLSVLARVNASGIVTLQISQQVSAPIPPSATGIQSPSFSNRTIETQVTIQDGDTIAIGGILDEQTTSTTSGIPFLNRIPYIGWVFGSRAYNSQKTELIIFITPKVIYDNNGLAEASQELKERLKNVMKIVGQDQ